MSSKTTMPFTLIASLNSLPSSPLDSELIPPTDMGIGPQGYVIRSINGLTQLGFVVDASSKGDSEAGWNSVDWSQYNLVILTLGVQGTTGHSIRVDRVEKTDDTITFAVTHVEPKGPVGEALTHPASMIKLGKFPADAKTILKINGKPVACDWHFLD